MASYSSASAPDVLSLDARRRSVALWGDTPPEAEALGLKLVAQHDLQVTGGELPREPVGGRRMVGNRHVPAVPQSRLDGADAERLARIASVHTDDAARAACSLGKSYADLVAARGSELHAACDLVVQPATDDQLARALAWLAEEDIAVVPLGGGSSVVGGVEPLGNRPDQPVAALDLSELRGCLDVDERTGVATFQAGILGPALEGALAAHGKLLGHVPQSFERSTLGGWIATRSAGQQSLRYGKIERMTAALEVITPERTLRIEHLPAHGAGPGGLDLMLGSEGTMGVISRATMRISPRPSHVRFASFVFGSFEAATDAARLLVQSGVRPASVRVSDAAETRYSVGASLPGPLKPSLARGLAARAARGVGWGSGSFVFVIIPGTHGEAIAIERQVASILRGAGGRGVGPMPARHWYHQRFLQAHARDHMMDAGLMVDTLETAAPWHRLADVHREVRAAMEAAIGGPDRAILGCHLSHLYPDGASLYFTMLAPARPGAELEQWRTVKRAANDAIARTHGAASHQHGVGTMHADLYAAVTAEPLLEAWRAARSSLDPSGILNPGKCFLPPWDGAPRINAAGPAVPQAAR